MIVVNNLQDSFELMPGDLVSLKEDFWSYNDHAARLKPCSAAKPKAFIDSTFHINNKSLAIIVYIKKVNHSIEYNDIIILMSMDGILQERLINSSCLRSIICKCAL